MLMNGEKQVNYLYCLIQRGLVEPVGDTFTKNILSERL